MKKAEISYSEIKQKLNLILRPESSFYIISVIYGTGVSILTLAIPISVQSLVNTVTFGVLSQPLVVLSFVLLSLLVFSGILNSLQSYIIEIFQRRFFARTSSDIVLKLLNSEHKELESFNAISLVNRYFDVMTVQKSVTTLLLGGVSMVLQTLVGLILLAFYHPYFLVFDIILIGVTWFVWSFFGKSAIISAIDESKSKYKLASWLEEIASNNFFFKTNKKRNRAIEISDDLINEYLGKRESHFKYVFSQILLLLFIYAVMSSLILGLGGFLVMQGQLTIGQLVAAELVVTVILSSFSKSGKYLESFYDLYAAVDKLSDFYNLKSSTLISSDKISFEAPYDLDLNNASIDSGDYHFKFNYKFLQGKNYYLNSKFFSSKLIFLDLIKNTLNQDRGEVSFAGHNFDDLNTFVVQEQISVLDKTSILENSIEENLIFGQKDIKKNDIDAALELVDLAHINNVFEKGLKTKLLPTGYPLWSSQLVRLEIARIILSKPKVVVLTEIFDQIERERRSKILEFLINSDMTIIMFSHRGCGDLKFDKYLSIDRENIEEFEDDKALLAFSRAGNDGP